jgi:hypothetical protein
MVVLALLVGFRLLQRRAAGVGPAERPHALTRETNAGARQGTPWWRIMGTAGSSCPEPGG